MSVLQEKILTLQSGGGDRCALATATLSQRNKDACPLRFLQPLILVAQFIDPLDSPIDGTWNLSVRTAQGDVTILVTLEAESGHVSGTFSGDKGSGDIAGGTFNKPALQFTISMKSEAAEASD